MSITLRHYQAGSKPALIKYLRADVSRQGTRHPLIALPTGSGKTYCIADIIGHFHKKWNTKILVLSHVKEILSQNHKTIEEYTGLTVGVYSAGLGRKDTHDVTVAGIQSVFRKPELFEDYQMIIVDEAHLISDRDNSMYQKFFKALEHPVIVGFTATPFRLGDGYIYGKDKMFDTLIYDWTTRHKFAQLVDEGWLSPLTAEAPAKQMDTEGIHTQAGDFKLSELSDKFDRSSVTNDAIQEILDLGSDRKQWLIFAIDIDHAEHIAEGLNRAGILTAIIHSKMSDYGFDRDKVIADVRKGTYRCVVNVDILTIGFDHPRIDLIALLRPTKSPVLHVQMLGRGSRIAEGKKDCLVLDFANNLATMGPINDPTIIIKGKGLGGGEPIMKTCPKCQLIVFAAARVCSRCKFKFPREHHLSGSAINNRVIDDGKPHWIEVDDVTYEKHGHIGRPNTLEVSYHCGSKIFKEYICLEHRGFAKEKADHWWKYRGGAPVSSIADAVLLTEGLLSPNKIRIQKKGQYYNISESSF